MAVFAPQPLKKLIFLGIFSSKWPPRKSQNAQFSQKNLEDDDVYFPKITAS